MGDKAYHVLVETYVYDVGMHIGGEAKLVFLFGHLTHKFVVLVVYFHVCHLVGACSHTYYFAKLQNIRRVIKEFGIFNICDP